VEEDPDLAGPDGVQPGQCGAANCHH
jgi:hypothetical protein